jgi:phosphatidylserine decarboxylase
MNLISTIAGKLAKSSFSKLFIPLFAKIYHINLDETERPLSSYRSLNDFFTRKLKLGSRIVDSKSTVVSPVDGTIAQVGKINDGTLIQAKGIDYSIEKLISVPEHKGFLNGYYMTIYLSPTNYHRIHSPIDGEIIGYEYIPGKLFPVNKLGVNYVKGLFTKNERLTTFFKVNNQSAALVKVGAFIVGSIQITYDENVHQKHRGKHYNKNITHAISVGKGDELGWFEFGSTVILLLDESFDEFDQHLTPGTKVVMGQILKRA